MSHVTFISFDCFTNRYFRLSLRTVLMFGMARKRFFCACFGGHASFAHPTLAEWAKNNPKLRKELADSYRSGIFSRAFKGLSDDEVIKMGNAATTAIVGMVSAGSQATLSGKLGVHSGKKQVDLSKKPVNSIYNQQLIKNAEKISTAKAGSQSPVPRDLNEQLLWKQVQVSPSSGTPLRNMNNDPRFSTDAGFQKMQVTHELPTGSNITIHYQYNSLTGKAYDMKITTPLDLK